MKENKDISNFDNIFKQQLENASSTPPAGVWEGISSTLATTATTTVAVVKTALWIKVGIGVLAATAVSTILFIATETKNNISSAIEKVNQPANNSLLVEEAKVPVEAAPIDDVKVPKKDNKEADKKTVQHQKEENPVINFVDKTQTLSSNTESEIDETSEGIKNPSQTVKDEPNEVEPIQKSNIEHSKDKSSEIPVRKIDSTRLFIPNVFTADGDGVNDVYLIDIKGEESVRIIIYDINMNIIFDTKNKHLGWNCIKPNGEEYPEGTYIVKVIYKFPGKPEKNETKPLKLIR